MKNLVITAIFVGLVILIGGYSGGLADGNRCSGDPGEQPYADEICNPEDELAANSNSSSRMVSTPFKDNPQKITPHSTNEEIGADFILSSMGPYTNPDYDALNPAVAYNSSNNQYLVVWAGSDDVIGEYEIWGQRVNAANGAQIGADFQISFIGPADDANYDANNPDVAYNSSTNEFLVVWSGDHYADGDFEIFARRVDAETGGLLGSMVRVSVMGPGIDIDYDAYNPAVVYNSTDNQYLVVWYGDDDTLPLVNNENEIWGRRLSAAAEWIDSDQVRLSEMQGSGDADYDAYNPDVAYNKQSNDYMVVWYGDKSLYNAANNEYEIWGQRLNASLGKMGAAGFRISHVGTDNDAARQARDPSITYNSGNNRYLVVWEAVEIADDLFDIQGQQMEANGIQVGSDDFFVSNSGVGPNDNYNAYNPDATYDRVNHEYLVVWQDDEASAGEFEIWGQRLNASSGSIIGNDIRMSDMGDNGNDIFDAQTPAIAYSGARNNKFLITWSGDNSTDGEFEIWAQQWTNGYKIFLPSIIK
jgi:hypothetical protein